MRGRKPICVAIDKRLEGRAWKASFFFYLYSCLLLPVSFVRESIVSSEGKSEQLNEKSFTSLSCVLAICLYGGTACKFL